MSSKCKSTINFSVRKSSRTTNKVNYSEKSIPNVVPNSDLKSKPKPKVSPKSNETIEMKKKDRKTRLRKQENKCDQLLDENDDKLGLSPTKIKKTCEVKPIDTPFSTAKQLLSLSIVDSVVGRDQECHQIKQWVTSHLDSKSAGSLYISGSAGTGKTLSVSHVMSQLKQTFDFKLITINCMSFRNSNSIFTKILSEIKHKKLSKQSDCLQAINDLLTDSKSDQMFVLILDELDQLDTKSHDVLNTIFLWTKTSKSKLILIGIANALDLTTRILSRIKALNLSNIEEMHFMPYNTQQIIAIIQHRLQRASDQRNVVISPVAIQLCARKIGSCSGDIRKALDVCRRALDLVEANDSTLSSNVQPLKASNDNSDSPKKTGYKNGPKIVDIPQIMSVLNQVYGQKFELESKKFLPFNQQIILCALLLLSKHRNLKEVKLSECHQIFVKICSKRGISYNGKNEGEFLSMCQLLEDYGFVSIKRLNQNIRNSKLSLRVDDSEIEHSLSDTQFLNSILKQSTAYLS